MKKRALITGITGMDGSHLADFLLTKDYEVFGLERRCSTKNRTNTKHLEGSVTYLQGDLSDQNSLVRALEASNPHEVYNLAAQSFVGESWNTPEQTGDITGLGVLRMLEAIRMYVESQDCVSGIKFYQASSSEMFGKTNGSTAYESTPFYPRSPYGVAKVYGHWITKNYRESYGMFNCCGILFNHESERRGQEFVTRKITHGIAKILADKADHIVLGNLDAKRDWGYAPDYVEAMWMMLQQDEPDDYVIATGEVHSVRDFLEVAFEMAGMGDWRPFVKQDDRFMRPAEVDFLRGDAEKAQNVLGWRPKTPFRELVRRMVQHDLGGLI